MHSCYAEPSPDGDEFSCRASISSRTIIVSCRDTHLWTSGGTGLHQRCAQRVRTEVVCASKSLGSSQVRQQHTDIRYQRVRAQIAVYTHLMSINSWFYGHVLRARRWQARFGCSRLDRATPLHANFDGGAPGQHVYVI